MSSDPDASAILASLDEPTAFVPIFQAHYDELHGFLRRRLGIELADELASEVFSQAFRTRRRYDPSRGSVRCWLYGIANRLITQQRRAEARRTRLAELPGASDAPLDEQAIAHADARALRPVLARALGSLSRDDRDALLLFAWAGLSYEEIAYALHVPVGTVRSRIHRARRQLQDRLPRLLDRYLHYTTPPLERI
jgi:RNA polymerase sigma factor (sigma-70 family)